MKPFKLVFIVLISGARSIFFTAMSGVIGINFRVFVLQARSFGDIVRCSFGSVISFIEGMTQFDRYGTWPGAMLTAVSTITLLGAGIAVKLLYFRDE